MTEKRFTFNGGTNCIEYDDKSILLDSYGEKIEELLNGLAEENKELKETLLSVLNQLYSSESSLIYEYSTDISNDEKELAEHFKEKYSKYGWKE